MRFVLEYVGAAFLSVVVGGALLYVTVQAPDSGLVQAGTLAEQELSELKRIGEDQVYSQEEMDQRISFSYEEKTYIAGDYQNLAERFTATDSKGKNIPVHVEQVISVDGETCMSDGTGTVFIREGVYSVYVAANGIGYKVKVPVLAASPDEEVSESIEREE